MTLLLLSIFSPQAELILVLASRRKQTLTYTLLQNLQHGRRRPDFRLADQNVEVLGHDHVADNLKPILPPNLLEDSQENIARTPTSQKRCAFVATAGNEVKVMMTVNALQTRRHAAPL